VEWNTWIALVVDAAAAVAFLGLGARSRSRLLIGVGLAFVAAGGLMVGGTRFLAPSWIPAGYALGFGASVVGFFALAKRFPPGRYP
jgi:hypothetical protein